MKNFIKFFKYNYLLILITGLGSLLFFYNLGKESFWLDESSSYFFTYRLQSLIRAILATETNMWIYYFILHVWLKFGDTEFHIRSLSVLFAIISIPGVYWLGCIISNRKVGLIAAILFVTHTFIITYAQEARAYSVFTCFTIYSSIFYLKSLKEDTLNNWLLYIFFTTCVIYSHVFSIYFLFVQAILTIRINKKISINKNYIFSVLIIFLLSLPLISVIASKINVLTNISASPTPTLRSFLELLRIISFESFPLLLVSLSLIIYGLVREFKLTKKINCKYIYLISAFIVPICTVFLMSLFMNSIFVPRYFIFTIPPFLLLISYGINKIPKNSIKYFILGLILVLNIRHINNYYLITRKDNWKELVKTVDVKTRNGDILFIYPPHTYKTFKYYTRNKDLLNKKNVKVVMVTYPISNKSNEVFSSYNLNLVTNTAKNNKRIWLITSHVDIVKERINQRNKIREIFEKYLNNMSKYKLGPTLEIDIYE